MRDTFHHRRDNWAAYVAAVRSAMSLSKAEFARRLGVDRGTIHRWESGTYRPSSSQEVVKFARATRVDLHEALAAAGFLPVEEPPERPVHQEPPDDPDVEAILARLRNPKVSREEKNAIRAQLRYMVEQADREREERDQQRRAS